MASEVKTTRPTTNDSFRELIERMDSVMHRIRERAYNMFAGRGYKDGDDLEDWLTAERELFQVPEAEMTELGDKIQIRIAAPGFGTENLEVTVLPKLIVVEGKMERKEKGEREQVYFSEFQSQHLMRRFPLPTEIDTDGVKATLSNGMLEITAKKAKREPEVQGTKVEVKEKESAAATASA